MSNNNAPTAASSSLSVREALRAAMREEMEANEDVFILGEEVAEYQGAYKVTEGMLAQFGPQRVIDTPITEAGFAGIAVGAAYYGLRPIVEFMTFNFSLQAMDQIVNSAAKTLYMSGGQLNVPIVFRGPNGAAAQVAAQHSQCFAAWFAHIPGLKVIAPYSPADAKGLLKSAIRDNNPVICLENEVLYNLKGDVPNDKNLLVPLGSASITIKGDDLTIISYAMGVHKCLKAATILKNHYNISPELIDLRSLRPMDTNTIINSVKKTHKALIVEEGWPACGIGAELIAVITQQGFDWLDAPVARLSGADVPLPYATNLETQALPQPDDIVKASKNLVEKP